MVVYIRQPGRRCVSFDAQCDLAAVVYGDDDDPDRLISGFAADLRRSGGRPVGVVQLGRSCRAENPRLGVVMLPDGEVVRLASQDFASQAAAHMSGCRLDPDRLASLATRLAAAIEAGADLVIINRFGRSEAEGKGLLNLIPQALEADIPVLIAVPERRFAAWIRFSEGMNVRLACRREALDRWWLTVTGSSRPRSGAGTFCEFLK
jgi:nucleoside-triphosphatase THEP1